MAKNQTTKRIGIDMRMAGCGEGIGRYVEELVQNLCRIDSRNQYFLLTAKGTKYQPSGLGQNFHIVEVASSYYSLAEQTFFIWELLRLKLDLVHFPNFNAPIFYPGKFVVTIHDLIHHSMPGRKKRRFFHRLAYRFAIWNAAKRAQKVITVSDASLQILKSEFNLRPEKIARIYEGINHYFWEKVNENETEEVKEKLGVKRPFLLFAGVWRQYKNLERLSKAFDILRGRFDIQLVLAGKIDSFYPEIRQAVLSSKYAEDILAPGHVSDKELRVLYQSAEAFVLPSLMEGFGLIGIEAQASGTPVAASDIPVLREVLKDGALYFDPLKAESIAQVLQNILSDRQLRESLEKAGTANARRFDWSEMAKKTLEIFEHATN